MNNSKLFELYYQSNPFHAYESSLKFFFEFISTNFYKNRSGKILDIGCGNYSLFEDVDCGDNQVLAFDISPTAIDLTPKSKISYLNASVCDDNLFAEETFDLIFDSHCLHCVNDEDLYTAYQNIHRWLKPNGMFAAELMVQPSGRKINIQNKNVKNTFEVESDLHNMNFRINYFVVANSMQFQDQSTLESIDLLRFIVTKK